MIINKSKITSITIGGFDGMHIAHQELFNNLDKNGAVVVIETGYANLTPKKTRQEYSKHPVYFYILESIKHLNGEEFISLLKEEFINLNKIVVGFDFCFGKNRKYCVEDLDKLFIGKVQIVKEVSYKNIPIHSRVIREYLKEGNILIANKLLGRAYKIEGIHIQGQGIGKKEFVATINLSSNNFLLPKDGIYISKTIIDDISYESVTFLGHRVTTDGSYAIETHILNKSIQNHKKIVKIEFLQRIRDNQKFNSFLELKEKIDSDIKIANDFFKEYI